MFIYYSCVLPHLVSIENNKKNLKIYCSIIWILAMSISWPFWCKFSFPQVLGFVALDWLWIYQIVKFKRLKYSPLNEEYRAHLTFILALRKGWEKWTKPTWLFFLRHPVYIYIYGGNWYNFLYVQGVSKKTVT